jgi:sulfate transport system ATP-binding protein
MRIRVENLHKRFGGFAAAEDVTFSVESGSLVALLGPSGGGKSTILRMIAGLEAPDRGRVWFDAEEATHWHARTRAVGFVFQHYALFRHRTVEENVAFGLEVRGVERAPAMRRAHELIALVGLAGFEKRYPVQLSGGQRQRVALARALAPEPKLLLLDEPFGAVDAKVREELRQWLRRLHDDVGVTSIFVTHDQDEAFSISDRVLVIHRGRLEQEGTPAEILDHPATEFVSRFVGEVNVIRARGSDRIATAGSLRIPLAESAADGEVNVIIRAYDFDVKREEPGNATIERVVTLSDRVRVQADVDGLGRVIAHFTRRSSTIGEVTVGCRVTLTAVKGRAYPATEEEMSTAAINGGEQ